MAEVVLIIQEVILGTGVTRSVRASIKRQGGIMPVLEDTVLAAVMGVCAKLSLLGWHPPCKEGTARPFEPAYSAYSKGWTTAKTDVRNCYSWKVAAVLKTCRSRDRGRGPVFAPTFPGPALHAESWADQGKLRLGQQKEIGSGQKGGANEDRTWGGIDLLP
jgi:hypothetical protein